VGVAAIANNRSGPLRLGLTTRAHVPKTRLTGARVLSNRAPRTHTLSMELPSFDDSLRQSAYLFSGTDWALCFSSRILLKYAC
jgi:hypothetical protein